MGKIKISRVEALGNEMAELSIQAILRSLRVSKISGTYYLSLGNTEIEISADLMKEVIEDAFMMLDYEDQIELLKTFSEYVR